MKDEVLQVAVVGASPTGGAWASRAHVPAVLATPGMELAAICTSRDSTARAAAELFGARRAYSDPRDLAADDDIDLVIVAVRPRLHQSVAWPALAAGKMVYCEWPLGLGASDARGLTDVAIRHDAITGVGLQSRHSPEVRYLKGLIAEGAIGRPLFFNSRLFMARPTLDTSHWWVHLDSDDAATLNVLTGHVTDLIQHLLGRVMSLSGSRDTRRPDDSYETGEKFRWSASDTVSYQAKLDSDVTGVTHVSYVSANDRGFLLEIFGDEGTLSIGSPTHPALGGLTIRRFGRAGGPRFDDLQPTQADGEVLEVPATHPAARSASLDIPSELLHVRSVSDALAAFRDACISGQPFHPNFADGLRLHQVLDALRQSSDEQRWVSVATADENS
jgi:predicted dehydrogenase